MKHEIHTCDICGQTIDTYFWYKVRKFVFHKEINEHADICKDCLGQLKAMREANLMAERKEE
jgi:hypothetical protein